MKYKTKKGGHLDENQPQKSMIIYMILSKT